MVRKIAVAATIIGLTAGPSRDARAQDSPRWLLGASGGVQAANSGFAQTQRFPLNAEIATLNADYRVGVGRSFDGELAGRIWRSLLIGVDVSDFRKSGRVQVAASLPHPLLFNRPRAVSGDSGEAGRTEFGVHMWIGWLLSIGHRSDLRVGGGPSYVRLDQSLVSAVDYTETFPFNTATFAGVSTEHRKDGTMGANVGVDLTMLLRRHVGVGAGVRFSRATANVDSIDGTTLSVDVGGFQIVAGVRARF
jgi:hypothetical protein